MNKKKDNYAWDVFISHATEDKNEVVLPLTDLLKKGGLKVWLDKQEILVGDSLRRKIEEGLVNSRFGVVILSKNFFKKEWPKKELDALVAREDGREKVILPVWHKISKQFIAQNFTLLLDKFSISTEDGLDVVSKKILEVVKKKLIKEDDYFSKQDISSILSAITYHRSRKGSYSDLDPILPIRDNLKKVKNEFRIKRFNKKELLLLLNIIDENIAFLNKYEYTGLSIVDANNFKQEILLPLFGVRKKILKIIEK